MNKTLKKTLSIILTILMIVTTVPFAFAAEETPPTREIDGETYYELDSADDLYWFAEYVNVGNYTANAILTADITVNENLMNKITLDAEGNAQVNEDETVREWISIGNSDNVWRGARFAGEFNGNGKVVSGVYMNSENTIDGFFGVVDSNAYIHDFIMRGSYICSANAGGFVSSITYGENIRLENLVNESTVRGWRAAGIVASAGDGGTIINCVNKGTIYGDYDDHYDAGYREAGIAESSINGTQIINCYNIGDVDYAIGGDIDEGLIINCYYLDSASVSGVNPNWSKNSGTTAKAAEAFASGEVCTAVGYHIGGTQTCNGYECEVCSVWYGEADADNHDWSNKDGVCANGCGGICEHENQTGEACSVCGTTLHICDFSGEWKYDGSKHWKECAVEDCDKISEEATHSFTDGKCVCGVERADYTDFDAAVEELRALLAREDLLYGPKQGYTSGLNSVLNSVGYNRIEKEQMAVNNGTQTLNGYIAAIKAGIENGSMIKADWSKMEALFDEINALIENDTNRIVDAYKGLYTGTQAYYNGCVNSATFTQQSYNNNIVYEQNLEELLAGLKDGTMLKFDAAMEAYKIYSDFLYAMLIEMSEKYGEDRVSEIDEKIKENGNGEIASAIINEVAGLTGSVAENADKLAELKAEMDAFIEAVDRCCSGTHTFENYAETTPAKCSENAKETGTCWLCGETDEREVPGTALEHSFVDYKSNDDATCEADGTKTAECIHNCGKTDTVTDEGSKLDHADEDGDKVCDDCEAEIVDTCPDCGRKAHGDSLIENLVCLIFMLIRLITSLRTVL